MKKEKKGGVKREERREKREVRRMKREREVFLWFPPVGQED